MSSAPTQIAVAPTTASLVSQQTQIQKDYLEEPISRQNSLGNRHRGGSKGKHLTRSHAMRESTSPPRTPTPRSSELITPTSPTGGLSPTSHDSLMDSRLNFQQTGSSSAASSPLLDTSSNLHHNSHSSMNTNNNNQSPPQIFSIDGGGNQSQLDLDFPKLTPPKSKSPRNNNNNNSNTNNNHINNNVVRESDKASNNNVTAINSSNGTTNTEQHHMNSKVVFNSNSVSLVDKSSSPPSLSLNVSPPTLVTVTTISTTNTTNNSNSNNCSTQVNDSSLLQVVNNSNSSNTASSQTNSVTNSTNVQLQQQQQLNNSIINVPSQQQQQHNSYDNKIECHSPRDNSNTRNDHSPSSHHTSPNNHSSNSSSFHNDDNLQRVDSPNDYLNRGAGGGGGGSIGSNSNSLNKKHRTGANTKSSKPRLKTMGSSSSVEGGNNSSGFISRDSSTEQFTDQSGVDLIQFFKETLNKNAKDRNMLMRIEKELLSLAIDRTRNQIKFPAMSSYNRMLIHRVAAYFGMEHNVDATQQSVIAAITKSTRVPEVRFKSLIRETFSEEPRKSILKRDAHSFDECRHFLGPDRGVLDRKAKSFEEREEEYEKVGHMEEHQWPWSSSDSSETNNQTTRLKVQNNRLLKVQSVEARQSSDGRPSVSKSHSFGGYGGQQNTGPLHRGDSVTSTKSAGPRLFTKQDSTGSTNTPWRLSPSSSGYKTQSIRSDSVTPSPTGYGSGDHTPEPSVVQSPNTPCGVVWAVTDMASVPRGSVLIDPQTLQPLVNQDGTIYHFDPSNLPPKSMATKPPTLQRNKFEKQKSIKSIVIQPHHGNECEHNLEHKTPETILHNVIDENVENVSVIDNNEIETQIEAKDRNESPSPCSNDEISLNSITLNTDTKTVVKYQKSQATSPNLPHNIPEFQATQHNEITTGHTIPISNTEESQEPQPISNECVNENNTNNMIQQTNNSGSINNNINNSGSNSSNGNNSSHSNNSSNSNSTINDSKKELEYKTQIPQSAITVMSYAPSYQGLENGAVYPGSTTTFPAYQQGADGSVYALPQQMMYAYPPTMESEVPGYFVPFYDQTGTGGRDGTTTLIATQPTGTTLYQQPTAGTTAVVPLATYPPPLYQGQVVYTQEQFTGNHANSQLSQYPLTYPVGYPYSYNGTYQGYWGQPMTTYYVPQTQLTASTPVSTSMIVQQPQSLQSLPTGGNCQSLTINQSNAGSNHHHHHHTSKRGSPPQTLNQAAQYATHSTVQISDPTTGTMYAIPPIYPSMLPYATSPAAAAAAAAAGVISHQIPHQNTVINSIMPSQLGGPPPQHNPTQAMEQATTTFHQINTNTTPQSTPSTPLSLPLSHHPQKNPLFATPPTLIPNGFTAAAAAAAAAAAQQITGCNEITTSYERKTNSTNSANTINRRTSYNNPNAINTRPSSNPSHQAGGASIITGTNGNGFYTTQNHHTTITRKYDGSSNTTTPRGNINTSGLITQKRESTYKPHHNNIGITGAPISMNQVIQNHSSGGTNSYEKIRGPRPKPSNLDLRRNNHNNSNINNNINNNSNRNTPSTNSTESNNSPNSITSNNAEHQTIYMTTTRSGSNGITTSGHLTQLHHQNAAAAAAAAHHIDPCHQQLISTYNPTGMYVKFGQYFTHPSMALSSNRRSPPTEIRPQLTPITGMYPMNVMLSAQRHIAPRPQNPNYKGNKPR